MTVAVQTAAGTAAIASTFPAIGPYGLEITIGVVLLLCFGNLRGIKEAGRFFAIPTYLFSGSVILMIVVGLIRQIFFHLPMLDPLALHGTIKVHHESTLVLGVTVFTFLRAFANGGASLTGIEAVSDAVGGLPAAGGTQRPPGAGHRGPDPRLPGGGHFLAGPRHPRHPAGERLPHRAGPGGGQLSSATRSSARSCSTWSRRRPR